MRYCYEMLIRNRIREYRRLLKNMWCPFLLLVVTSVIFGGGILKGIRGREGVPVRLTLLIIAVVLCHTLYSLTVRLRPVYVVKPMTLYLFNDEQLKELLLWKRIGLLLKHTFQSAVLASFAYGLAIRKGFWISFTGILLTLELTACLRWHEYRRTRSRWQYGEEMGFWEKLLTAQNYNNPILLNRYMQEIRLRSIRCSGKNSKLLDKYPIIWKARISIMRLAKSEIMIGAGMFFFAFLVYEIPAFWRVPFLEQYEIRQALLLFGILAIIQLTLQSMLKQVESLWGKAKEGLFLPYTKREILIQFTVIPVIIMVFLIILQGVLLRFGVWKTILTATVLAVLTVCVFFLKITRSKVFDRIYFASSIIIFLISLCCVIM